MRSPSRETVDTLAALEYPADSHSSVAGAEAEAADTAGAVAVAKVGVEVEVEVGGGIGPEAPAVEAEEGVWARAWLFAKFAEPATSTRAVSEEAVGEGWP
jgi:hypothetical protein